MTVVSRLFLPSRAAFVLLLLVILLLSHPSPGVAGSWNFTPVNTGSSSAGPNGGSTPGYGTWVTGESLGVGSTCLAGAQATASSSGTIKFICTWQATGGDNVADPPPKKLMLRETADAHWGYGDYPARPPQMYGSVGTTNASIGDIPDNNPYPAPVSTSVISGGKRGTRIKPYDVPASGILEVSCAVSAGVSFNASPLRGGSVSVYVSYSVSLTDVRILRDNAAIAAANNNDKCLPGEAINLSVAGADPGTTYKWTEPDNKPFKTYNTGAIDRQQLVKLSPSDLQQSAFSFYFTFGDGSKHKVTCTVKVGGANAAVEDEITVVEPESIMTPLVGGSVDFLPNSAAPTFAGFGSTGLLDGMNWLSKVWVTEPTLAGPHQYCHVQLIAPRRWARIVTNSGPQIIADSGNSVTDSTNKWLDGTFVYDGPYSTGSNTSMSPMGGGDSPGDEIDSADWLSGVILTGVSETDVEHENFTTYLMFKPSSANSCWVPLRSFDWFWEMKAVYTSSTWSMPVKSNTTSASSSKTQDHPLWEQSN